MMISPEALEVSLTNMIFLPKVVRVLPTVQPGDGWTCPSIVPLPMASSLFAGWATFPVANE
jgi:hypothetical protein